MTGIYEIDYLPWQSSASKFHNRQVTVIHNIYYTRRHIHHVWYSRSGIGSVWQPIRMEVYYNNCYNDDNIMVYIYEWNVAPVNCFGSKYLFYNYLCNHFFVYFVLRLDESSATICCSLSNGISTSIVVVSLLDINV